MTVPWPCGHAEATRGRPKPAGPCPPTSQAPCRSESRAAQYICVVGAAREGRDELTAPKSRRKKSRQRPQSPHIRPCTRTRVYTRVYTRIHVCTPETSWHTRSCQSAVQRTPGEHQRRKASPPLAPPPPAPHLPCGREDPGGSPNFVGLQTWTVGRLCWRCWKGGGLGGRGCGSLRSPPPQPHRGATPAQALTDQRPGSGTLPRRCCRAAALWRQKRP